MRSKSSEASYSTAALTDVQILRIQIELTSGQSITFPADVGRPCKAIVVLIRAERCRRSLTMDTEGDIFDEDVSVMRTGESNEGLIRLSRIVRRASGESLPMVKRSDSIETDDEDDEDIHPPPFGEHLK